MKTIKTAVTKLFPKKHLCVAMGAAIIFSPVQALADSRLEEIIVTAQKRAQSLDDLGMTVSVLSSGTMDERQLTNVEEIANVVPGLSFTKSNTTVPVYTLRGVGFYDNGLNAYPTVTVYIDESPLPFSSMTSNIGFDMERLEVLKGPQGILFGSNATGGALNFIAKKPTEEFEAGITLGAGRFNEIRAVGFVSGPLSDSVRARLAVMSVDADDWQQDYITGDETGETDVKSLRLSLEWDTTDSLRTQLVVNSWADKSDPQAAQYFQYQPQDVSAPANALDSLSTTPHNARDAGFTSDLHPDDVDQSVTTDPYTDNSMLQTSLRFDYELNETLTLTSLTAYADFEQDMALDRDGISLRNFDLPFIDGSIESIFQEVRLAGDSEQTRWMVGLNYSKDKVSEFYTMDWPDSTTRIANDPPFLGRSAYYTNQEMKNQAVFFNVEQDLNDFTVKIGGRYTESERDAYGCNRDIDGFGIAPFFTGLSQITRSVLGLDPSALSTVQPNACSLIDTAGVDGNAPTGLPVEDHRLLEEDNVSWRLGVDWRVATDTLAYVNIAEGYKAGSVPGVPSTFNEQTLAVTQESVLSYELGVKTQVLDGSMSLNATAFYYDYKDKQLRSRYVNSVFGLLDRLVNVPESSVEGIELEVAYRPIDALSLYANYVYLQGEITEFEGVSAEGVAGDFAGEEMPYSPEHQIAIGGEYEWDIDDGMTVFLAADYNYRSDTTAIIAGSATYDIDAYGLLDLRLGVRGENDKWSAYAWGKNVTDEYYWNNVSGVFDTITRYAGRPANYGLTFSYNF